VARERRAGGGPGQDHINHHGSQSLIDEGEDLGTDSLMANAVQSTAHSSLQGSVSTTSCKCTYVIYIVVF
jgi:hypothetical protein